MPKFKVGGVYKFKKPFSDRIDEDDAKKRYFLYLGNTSELLSNPVFVYVATSTTQLQQFESGGDKSTSNFLKFYAGEYGFTDDCAICFDEVKTYMTESLFESYEPEEKGLLDAPMLKNVYEKILASKRLSKIIKIDIHDCFNTIVTGLKMPR